MHEHFNKPVMKTTEVKPTIVENLGSEKVLVKESANPQLIATKETIVKKDFVAQEKDLHDDDLDEHGKKKGFGTKIKELFTGHS